MRQWPGLLRLHRSSRSGFLRRHRKQSCFQPQRHQVHGNTWSFSFTQWCSMNSSPRGRLSMQMCAVMSWGTCSEWDHRGFEVSLSALLCAASFVFTCKYWKKDCVHVLVRMGTCFSVMIYIVYYIRIIMWLFQVEVKQKYSAVWQWFSLN